MQVPEASAGGGVAEKEAGGAAAAAAADQALLTRRAKVPVRRWPQYLATFVVDILHLIYGLSIGWSAVALPVLLDTTSGPGFSMAQGSWLAAALYISAVPSMPAYGHACERYGRKACGYLIGAPFVVSALLLALSASFPAVLASRVLLGVASGGIFVFAPLYVSEIVEDALRGSLGAVVALMRNAGILAAYVLGTFLSYKTFEYICIAPHVLFLVVFYWLPESPVHLLRQKKETEARAALQWLRGSRADVEEEMERTKASLTAMNSEGAKSATLRDLFATRGTRKAFLLGIMLTCNQQFSGFFGVVSYTFLIFREASPSLKDASNVIVGAMLVLGIGVSIAICDRVARKTLLLASNVPMIFSLVTLGIYFYLKDIGNDVSSYGWIPVASLSVYVMGFSIGLAALPLVIQTEIYSPKIRNIGITIVGMLTWFLIFVMTKTFPALVDVVGFHGTCWFYASFTVLGVSGLMKLLPETRNRKLESIIQELEGKTPNSQGGKEEEDPV